MVTPASSQVGPGKYTGKVPTPKVTVPTPTPTPTPTTTGVKPNSIFDKLNAKLKDKGVTGAEVTDTKGASLIDVITQDKAKATLLGKMLKARGKQVGASVEAIRNLFLSEPELASIATQAGDDYNKLVSLLSSDFLPGLSSDKPDAPNYPSRNVYKYTDDDIDLLINNVYQGKLMRTATEQELEDERKKIRPQLEVGTLSTTKNVRNPKTGKMETVTVQQGGPTKEAIASDIGKQLELINPDEVDRTARINFSDWLSQNVQGA
jgi:hypothetical protein